MIWILSAVLAISSDFKYYSPIFKTLPQKTFYRNGDHVYSYKRGEKDDAFIWFISRNEFCLGHGHYLHNASFTYNSLYGWYWLIKYRRWFKQNVNIETIEEW